MFTYPVLSRRALLAGSAAAALSTLAPARPARAAGSTRQLRVLAWPGYADPDVVASFEERCGCRVSLTVIDSDDALWQRMQPGQGGDFDLLAVNTAELQRYVAAGLVQPVPNGALRALPSLLPRFRDLSAIAGLVHGGRPYAVPYTFAEMGLIYDRRQLREPPTSIAALWDPRWKGRVLAYDGGTHNFSLAAQAMGLPSPFRLGARDWAPAVDRLIALRRNVLGFYTQPEDSVEQFMRRGAALMFANYGSQQLKLLQAAGADVGYAIPREGALAWLDCWAVSRGASDLGLVADWIDHLLGPAASRALVERQGLANTREPSPYHQPQDRLWWLEPVEDTDRRTRMWARIMAGDRAARVLAA